MEIQGFRIEMREEIRRKWESRLKILADSFEKKSEALVSDHKSRKKDLKTYMKNKKAEDVKKAEHDGDQLRLRVLSRLSREFKTELLAGLEEHFISEEGEKGLLEYMDKILEDKAGFTVIIGRKQKLPGFLKGGFDYGFRVVCPESGVEYDYTELFLKSVLEERVDTILEEEILDEDT